MARMTLDIRFSGTIGRINYYQSEGKMYARIKSSLTRKRVLEEKEFEKTRKYAGDMGRASRIASAIYRALPKDIKGRWIFRAITGEAASLIYKGKEDHEVKEILCFKYLEGTGCGISETISSATINKTPSTRKINLRFRTMFLDRWEKQGKPAWYFKRAWKKGQSFNPETIPRRSEYFMGLRHAVRRE
jgi:hypothetical protein